MWEVNTSEWKKIVINLPIYGLLNASLGQQYL